jgi:hypothetical protein
MLPNLITAVTSTPARASKDDKRLGLMDRRGGRLPIYGLNCPPATQQLPLRFFDLAVTVVLVSPSLMLFILKPLALPILAALSLVLLSMLSFVLGSFSLLALICPLVLPLLILFVLSLVLSVLAFILRAFSLLARGVSPLLAGLGLFG